VIVGTFEERGLWRGFKYEIIDIKLKKQFPKSKANNIKLKMWISQRETINSITKQRWKELITSTRNWQHSKRNKAMHAQQ
jgi:hypothetical protein